MNETVDLDLLGLFVAVAEAGSFSLAAKQAGLPKSTVSRGIARLEEQVGAQLLHRTTRRLALSTAGQALHREVAPLLASVREAVASLPERDELPSGELRLTAPQDLGATFLGALLARFTARYPRIRVDARLTNRWVDVVAEGFDVALRAARDGLEDSTLVVRRISAIQMGIFASPEYLERRGTPRRVEDLASHEWVAFRGWKGGRLAASLDRARLVGDDFLFVREAVRAGAGLALLPTFHADADLAAGRLLRVLPAQSERGGWFVLLHPRARRIPRKVTAFRDFLLESMASDGIGTT